MMVVIAILLDLLSVALYIFQRLAPTEAPRLISGLVIQALIVLALLVLTFSYRGKRFSQVQPVVAKRILSIRFAIIVISLIIAAAVEFLYVLNYLGVNQLIFAPA